MSKIKVWNTNTSSKPTNAIKVFDSSVSAEKPNDAILVCSGDEGPVNAIKVNVVNDYAVDAIPVWFASNGDTPVPPGPEPTLPPYTIRLKYKQGITPTFSRGTGVLYDAEQNIWDLTCEDSNWSNLLQNHSDLLEVLGANTTGVTSMYYMFVGCSSLTSVSLFDTSHVSNMNNMFNNCSSLTSVPLFNTSNVSNMTSMLFKCTSLTTVPLFDTSNVDGMNLMLQNCYNVESGALALYQQASTQANPPTYHYGTFRDCGRDTETGAAELAQIPADWK